METHGTMTGRRTTVIDIASAAGVSKSTVSLVLQGSPLVKEDTRARVNAVIRDLGYVYNRGAANLRQSNAKSKIIGVVVNDLTNSFFAELAVGIDMVVQSAGYVQFLSNSAESLDRQQEVIASMREHGISGLIMSPARGTRAEDLNPVVASGIPVVVTVRHVPGAKASTLLVGQCRRRPRGRPPSGRPRPLAASPSSAALPTPPSSPSASTATARRSPLPAFPPTRR